MIKTEEEFIKLMEQVDKRLQEREDPIASRELGALGEFAKILNVTIKGGPLPLKPIPSVYSGDSLSLRIRQWIQKKYGSSLAMNAKVGKSVLIL